MRLMTLAVALCVFACGNKSKSDRPMLINGEPALPGEYPEVVNITMNGGRCSSTLVSTTTLITAAHCIDRDGDTVRFTQGQNQYSARCERHPKYPNIADVDVAVCLVTRPVINFDRPAIVNKKIEKGDVITLAGYGCTRAGGTGGNDGILRKGNATVTGFSGYDMVSSKGAALCFGDSGGPAFKRLDEPKNEVHYIVGVNSKGNIRDTSYNLMLQIEDVRKWLRAWSIKTKSPVCGVTDACAREDQPDPDPEDPDTDPEDPDTEPDDPELCKSQRKVWEFYAKRQIASKERLDACMQM